MACRAYSEQVGVYLQAAGNHGEITFWYTEIATTIGFFMRRVLASLG